MRNVNKNNTIFKYILYTIYGNVQIINIGGILCNINIIHKDRKSSIVSMRHIEYKTESKQKQILFQQNISKSRSEGLGVCYITRKPALVCISLPALFIYLHTVYRIRTEQHSLNESNKKQISRKPIK